MIEFSITGDQAVIRMLNAKVPALTKAVLGSVTRASIMLLRYVKEHKLSGQVLKNRTGTLRRKVNYRVTQNATTITGSVGVKLSYARIHEMGFDGTENVKAHLRTIKQAFGRRISPVSFEVRAHSRHVHMPRRSFLASALRDKTSEIQGIIRAGVVGATQ